MQERKNKRRFAFAVVLAIATVLAFWLLREEDHLDIDQHIFQVEQMESIDKIEIQSDTGKILLAFNGTNWRVDEKFEADGNMVNVLFATLQQARPKRRIGKNGQDSVYNQVLKRGVKVSLFEGGTLRKEFYAGGNAAKTQAYFIEPRSKETYAMAIPGYRVYVSGIFEMAQSGWRDKRVFTFNWRNFKSLRADFPKRPFEDFAVSLNKGLFGVEGIETDTVKLNAFFDKLFALTADEFAGSIASHDSLKKILPLARFIIQDVANRSYSLTIFVSEKRNDALGIIDDADVAIFNRRKIQPILRPKSFFRKK